MLEMLERDALTLAIGEIVPADALPPAPPAPPAPPPPAPPPPEAAELAAPPPASLWRRILRTLAARAPSRRTHSLCAHSLRRRLSFSSALASTTFHSSSGSASAHARILRFSFASTLRPISSHSCCSRRERWRW